MTQVDGPRDEESWSPGWRSLALAALCYLACAAAATWPRVLTIRTNLPGVSDAVTHLWTLRWYKASLLAWTSPYFNPGIQAPVGSPIGLVPPMHFQSLLYLLGSSITANDILCYNAIWFASYVFAGTGVFWLTWYVVRDRKCAGLAGLLAMLCAPMMAHGFGHLELIQIGWFPIFLIAWTRMVDRPSGRRLAASAALYLLVAMSAPYFAIFAIFPAVLYGIWSLVGATRSEGDGWKLWLRARAGWASAFVGLAGAGLVILYSGQIWAAVHGFTVTRSRTTFLNYGAPPWGYFVPTRFHLLGHFLPVDAYEVAGMTYSAGERGSYLGVVTLLLLAYGAIRRVRFPNASYWWAAFGVLVVLSFGGAWRLGPVKIPLPASWFLGSISPLRLMRVPARFNLFAGVCSAVLAGAALKDLLGRVARPRLRPALAGGLMVVALVDLAVVPYGSTAIPEMPACYEALKRADPGASFVEGPQYASSDAIDLSALGAYWQSFHRGRTTAGYTAQPNLAFDDLMSNSSPFSIYSLAHPHYLANPDNSTFDLIHQVGFRDYVWLYLTRHDFRYVVLHKTPMAMSGHPVRLDRAQAALRDTQVSEDADTLVFDRARLPAPSKPVALCVEGWNQVVHSDGARTRSMARIGHLAVFNPDPARELFFALEATAFEHARTARLLSGSTELARFRVEPGPRKLVITPPFRLPAGLQELTLETDGADRPTRHRDIPPDGDRRPISLRVSAIVLSPHEPAPAVASKDVPTPK